MNPYSIYEYLTFILPGASVLGVAIYAWFGWPWKEPGATALVGILGASFVVGNLLAAFATWLEPTLLGGRPGSRPDGLWGQFGDGDRHANNKEQIEDLFKKRYGEQLSLDRAYRLAQTELRALGKAEGLDRINPQLGFYRGMTVAALISLIVEVALAVGWHTHLLPALWIPILAGSVIMFSYRFRRFWRWYGDYVIRGVQLLDLTEPTDRPPEADKR